MMLPIQSKYIPTPLCPGHDLKAIRSQLPKIEPGFPEFLRSVHALVLNMIFQTAVVILLGFSNVREF